MEEYIVRSVVNNPRNFTTFEEAIELADEWKKYKHAGIGDCIEIFKETDGVSSMPIHIFECISEELSYREIQLSDLPSIYIIREVDFETEGVFFTVTQRPAFYYASNVHSFIDENGKRVKVSNNSFSGLDGLKKNGNRYLVKEIGIIDEILKALWQDKQMRFERSCSSIKNTILELENNPIYFMSNIAFTRKNFEKYQQSSYFPEVEMFSVETYINLEATNNILLFELCKLENGINLDNHAEKTLLARHYRERNFNNRGTINVPKEFYLKGSFMDMRFDTESNSIVVRTFFDRSLFNNRKSFSENMRTFSDKTIAALNEGYQELGKKYSLLQNPLSLVYIKEIYN